MDGERKFAYERIEMAVDGGGLRLGVGKDGGVEGLNLSSSRHASKCRGLDTGTKTQDFQHVSISPRLPHRDVIMIQYPHKGRG
jgi:hypothetical protein